MFEDSSWMMQSTHFQTLEAIGEVPPLKLRFSMLRIKSLSSRPFCLVDNPFDGCLRDDYDLEPVRSDYDYPLEA
jgi:hypothetical protein